LERGKWRSTSPRWPRSPFPTPLLLSSNLISGYHLFIFTLKDGQVPKNKYGNVWLYKPEMLPIGTRHVRLENLMKIARRLNIDIAPAMVLFYFIIYYIFDVNFVLFLECRRDGSTGGTLGRSSTALSSARNTSRPLPKSGTKIISERGKRK